MPQFLGEPLNVVSLNQVEKDTVMVGYDHILYVYCMWVGLVWSCDLSLTKLSSQYCKFVDRNGVLKPSVRQASQLVFDYKADALGMMWCHHLYSNVFIHTVRLQDCVLNFNKHGMQVCNAAGYTNTVLLNVCYCC